MQTRMPVRCLITPAVQDHAQRVRAAAAPLLPPLHLPHQHPAARRPSRPPHHAGAAAGVLLLYDHTQVR